MAEKRVSVRLVAEGGRQVRAELEGIGEAGTRGLLQACLQGDVRASKPLFSIQQRGGEGPTPVAFPPPLALAKAFSRSGSGRIFPLYSRVMRVGLSTGPGAKRPGSGLSGPIFSGPVDCARLVNFL